MKVLTASKPTKSNNSKSYNWCKENDLLMFGQFQVGKGNPSEISMCGIANRKFTTDITVKDIDISKEFYTELLAESVEKAMNCKVDEDGNFDVSVGFNFKFNIHTMVNELLKKAECFNNGDTIKCFGRELTITDKSPCH